MSLVIAVVMSYSSKNPYGNKTKRDANIFIWSSYSSKNPYGNKTFFSNDICQLLSYSSKNPYGNKTIDLEKKGEMEVLF